MIGVDTIAITASLRERFEASWNRCHIYLFSAPCGYGKTSTARKLLSAHNVIEYSAADHAFSIDHISQGENVLLLDDLHLLSSNEQQRLCALLHSESNRHIVLLSRGHCPNWLIHFQNTGVMQTFYIDDLRLDQTTVQELFEMHGLVMKDDDVISICRETEGYPALLSILCHHMCSGAPYDDTIRSLSRRELFHYLDDFVYRKLEPPVRWLVLRLAPFDAFNEDLAKIICGDNHAGERLEQLRHNTSMIVPTDNNNICFRPLFRDFLRWELEHEFTEQDRRNIFAYAGLYYELNDNISQALDLYSQAGDNRKVSELLIKSTKQHKSDTQYYQLKEYYFALPRDEIMRSPVLICGMSMLCSLSMDYDQSEKWYSELQSYAFRIKKSDTEYRDTQCLLAYLDISLPQRGTAKLSETFTNLFHQITDKSIARPTISITNTFPSLINGSKDLCEWSRKGNFLQSKLRKSIEGVLGSAGVGMMDCAICESKFEMGEDYQPQLLTLMSRMGEIQRNGAPDIEFAVVGLLARIQIAQGKATDALEAMQTLRDKFADVGAVHFLPNIDGMICRIQLHLGNTEETRQWYLEKAPKKEHALWPLWRYQYMTKAMVDLTHNLKEVLQVGRLLPYTEICARTIDRIQIKVLMALSHFRTGDDLWRFEISEALDSAAECRFVRPIAEYGAAVLPLLTVCGWKRNGAFLERVIDATRDQAVNYPNYLKQEHKLSVPLTAMELQVLKLLCHHKSNQDVCEILGVQMTTTKTHVSHIFEKLNVNRRSEAVEAAYRLHLL